MTALNIFVNPMTIMARGKCVAYLYLVKHWKEDITECQPLLWLYHLPKDTGSLFGGSNSKEAAYYQRRRQERHRFHPFVGTIPWRLELQSTPVFLPGKFHGQRTLVGYKSMESQRVGHDWVTNTTTTKGTGLKNVEFTKTLKRECIFCAPKQVKVVTLGGANYIIETNFKVLNPYSPSSEWILKCFSKRLLFFLFILLKPIPKTRWVQGPFIHTEVWFKHLNLQKL